MFFIIPNRIANTNSARGKYITDDNWCEAAITWKNQPASGNELARTVFDITDQVIAEEEKEISILLYEISAGWQEFRYKETPWTDPYLQLEVQLQ